MALGPRGDNWQWCRRGPRDLRAGEPRAQPHRHCRPLAAESGSAKRSTRGDSKAGTLAFPRIQACRVSAGVCQPPATE